MKINFIFFSKVKLHVISHLVSYCLWIGTAAVLTVFTDVAATTEDIGNVRARACVLSLLTSTFPLPLSSWPPFWYLWRDYLHFFLSFFFFHLLVSSLGSWIPFWEMWADRMIMKSLHSDSLLCVARDRNLRLFAACMGSLCFSSSVLMLEHMYEVVKYGTKITVDSQNCFRK